MFDLFEIFVRSLGEGAPEPKVRLTMTCPRAGHFFTPIRDFRRALECVVRIPSSPSN